MGATSISANDPSPGRSFLSRLAQPFKSVNRNLDDFHIRPDEPHRHYAAGDHVRGAVILAITKPVRITHLVVALHGYVRVYKGPAGVTEPVVVPSGTTRVQYHGRGYASLFQDEQVLSGEGRLEPGKYQFQFDLEFPNEKGLPSSIDFERGTIRYNIVATLTRPTSIAPTTQCDRKVSLIEQVDIGALAPPRPRTIFLEPISKKSRRKKPRPEKPPPVRGANEPPSDSEVVDTGNAAEEPGHECQQAPHGVEPGDVRSEFSGDSGVSTSTGPSVPGAELLQPAAKGPSQSATAKLQAVDAKTITTTIELLKGGCMAGDTIPVKVTVQHIKRVQSTHGVIVTLYRQGRIDSAPPSTSFAKSVSKEEARRMARDDYYPRSKTGLGGLSLSSASSLSVFRKDLAQSMAPLMIDPETLSTSVTVTVKVPEDSFPTIRNVPGEMISFKYHLEVIVDLGGRLSSQIQSGGGTSRVVAVGSNNPDGGGALFGPWPGNLVDTAQLKREKGVIYDGMEVVVGTVDSSRGRAKGISRVRSHQQNGSTVSQDDIVAGWRNEGKGPTNGHVPLSPSVGYASLPPTGDPIPSHIERPPGLQAPTYIPPPTLPDESGLSEKDRIRRQEERLLPSQPPQDPSVAGPSSSAPPGEIMYETGDIPDPASPQYSPRDDGPSAPTLAEVSVPPPSAPLEDKQELERQRLLDEASAPPEFPDDYEVAEGSAVPRMAVAGAEPSAPVLEEDDAYGAPYTYDTVAATSSPAHVNGPEPLPRYER